MMDRAFPDFKEFDLEFGDIFIASDTVFNEQNARFRVTHISNFIFEGQQMRWPFLKRGFRKTDYQIGLIQRGR